MGQPATTTVLEKARACYKSCALFFFNTFVLLALVNGALWVFYAIKDSLGHHETADHNLSTTVINKYGEPLLRQAYEEYSADDFRSFMHETWDRQLEFAPFVQFKERAHAGKWVNVDRNGFRLSKNNGPWPPARENLNIFMFGGSTTFGYGVPDDQTIASYLQDYLLSHFTRAVKIYNFGAGWYYSTQERVLFCSLLSKGFVPDVAVFVDGLNDFKYYNDEPSFTKTFEDVMNGAEPKRLGSDGTQLSHLPMMRLAGSMKARLSPLSVRERDEGVRDQESYDDRDLITTVLKRYGQNRRLIGAAARAFGVRPLLVWQPVPTYKYELKHHPYRLDSFGAITYTRYGYPCMAKAVGESPGDYGNDFLWLADIQERSTASLYVDQCHYSASFSKEIAGHIGRCLLERQFLAKSTDL